MMKNFAFQTSPSQLDNLEPAPVAGFSFSKVVGDGIKTMKKDNYKKPKIKKGKKWFIEFYYRRPDTGRFQRYKIYEEINRYKGQEQEDYARDLRDKVELFLKTSPYPVGSRMEVAVKNWTLIQGLNYFKQNLEGRGLRKRTVQTYQSVIKMLSKESDSIRNDNIRNISKIHIQQILLNAKLKHKWTNTTFNNNLTFTKAIFNYLIDQEILEISPAERIKPLPAQITKHRYFDNKTFQKIKEKADPELLSFIMFLYHTGTRPNEARQLTHENILIDRKLLFIPASISKNKKDDYVPLTDYVLKNYGSQTGNLFKTQVNYYGNKFAKLKKYLKLNDAYTLYSIKHSRAIHLAQDGADPYTIMNLFRHSGLDITMSYLRELGLNLNREATTKGIHF